MSEKIQKLKDKVEISGDLLTQMFNYIAGNAKYAEAVGLVAEFNKQMIGQTEEVDLSKAEEKEGGK